MSSASPNTPVDLNTHQKFTRKNYAPYPIVSVTVFKLNNPVVCCSYREACRIQQVCLTPFLPGTHLSQPYSLLHCLCEGFPIQRPCCVVFLLGSHLCLPMLTILLSPSPSARSMAILFIVWSGKLIVAKLASIQSLPYQVRYNHIAKVVCQVK